MFGLMLVACAAAAILLYFLVKSRVGTAEPVIPLVLTREDDTFVVHSPLLPELHTQGDSEQDAVANARDALVAVKELYADLGQRLPDEARDADPASVKFVLHPRLAA